MGVILAAGVTTIATTMTSKFVIAVNASMKLALVAVINRMIMQASGRTSAKRKKEKAKITAHQSQETQTDLTLNLGKKLRKKIKNEKNIPNTIVGERVCARGL